MTTRWCPPRKWARNAEEASPIQTGRQRDPLERRSCSTERRTSRHRFRPRCRGRRGAVGQGQKHIDDGPMLLSARRRPGSLRHLSTCLGGSCPVRRTSPRIIRAATRRGREHRRGSPRRRYSEDDPGRVRQHAERRRRRRRLRPSRRRALQHLVGVTTKPGSARLRATRGSAEPGRLDRRDLEQAAHQEDATSRRRGVAMARRSAAMVRGPGERRRRRRRHTGQRRQARRPQYAAGRRMDPILRASGTRHHPRGDSRRPIRRRPAGVCPSDRLRVGAGSR